MFGWFASIATAGSFWWFWGVFPLGLPTVTRLTVAAVAAGTAITSALNTADENNISRFTGPPFSG
jgi:hypothetical protein